MKKKTYVLTLSKTFLKGHPRAGTETGFKRKFLNGEKIHTLRGGEYWKEVIDKVNAGIAILSVRQWSGEPYNSKQVEIGTFESVAYQDVEIRCAKKIATLYVDNKKRPAAFYNTLAANDGLSLYDFMHWFNYPKPFKGVIIHFTDFRYK